MRNDEEAGPEAGAPWTRRAVLETLGATGLAALAGGAHAAVDAAPLRFGLTPVFLDSDTHLLGALEHYLSRRLARPVLLAKRRTYQRRAR
ncbi:hypothetical protein [Azospirillum doebereinerae]